MQHTRPRTFLALALVPVALLGIVALAATLNSDFANSLSPHESGGIYPYFMLLLLACVFWTPAMLLTAVVVRWRARHRASPKQ